MKEPPLEEKNSGKIEDLIGKKVQQREQKG